MPLLARFGIAALVVGALIVVVLLLSGGKASLSGAAPTPGTLADPVPYDGRSPGQPSGDELRVLVQLSRKPLGELANARAMGAEQQATWIKSLKREQITLRHALEANGIQLRDVVSFYRVYNGFAATVRAQDIGRLNSPGARVRSVRRVYPASGEPVPVPGKAPAEKAAPAGQPPIALLDTGVDPKALRGHLDAGYDAVDRDTDPSPGRDPAGTGRRETSGTAVAGVLAQAGERVLPIRVASLRASPDVEAVGTTDELIAGLERAVDPNGDLDSSDHVPVALVGVNSPYAGFEDSPEAQAVAGAAGLGTLTVAPAGDEGAGRPVSGTIGSPAAAPDALAVGALAGPEPAPRVDLKAGGSTLAHAAVLAGDPAAAGRGSTGAGGGSAPAGALESSGPVTTSDPAALSRLAPRIRRTAVIVRAGANPAAQAAAVAALGAYVVLLAEPRDRPLPAIPAGRSAAPVIGVTGAGGRALLKVKPGTEIAFGAVARGPRSEEPSSHAAAYTSAGPSAGGLAKPDLAAAGSALTVTGGGRAAVAGGTAIAAARVAATAARLARAHPELSPAQLRAELMAAADPANLPAARTGAGALREPGAGTITADPPSPASGPLDPIRFTLTTTATTTLTLKSSAQVTPATVTVRPGAPAQVSVRPQTPGAGRVLALDGQGRTVASVPFLVRPQDPASVPLGPLLVSGPATRRRVRFTLGAFDRGDPLTTGTDIRFAERLVLDLVDAKGNPVKTLTLPGGARELMPAEYAYTIPSAALQALPPGRYRFRARAWAPRRAVPTERLSAPFAR